jgi:alginate O-acetyltransferase complex protein AlgI
MEVISQITLHFTPKIFLDFIFGYKTVLLIMLMGYVLHFLPHQIELKAEKFVTDASLAGKAAMMFCLIVLVIQIKSSGIQPFIYFQF